MHAPLEPSVRAEWRRLAALDTHRRGMARARRARARAQRVLRAGLCAGGGAGVRRDAGAVLVWTGGRRLIGLFPARIERGAAPLPMLAGWTHPFAPLGTPLVDRDEPKP